MKLSSLTALSSVDGRYATKTEALRSVCSEYGLVQRRTLVEIRWFQAQAAHPDIPELPALSDAAGAFLDELVDGFDEAAARRVKEIEAVTNHDVKAIEYYLKERFAEQPELAASAEFLLGAISQRLADRGLRLEMTESGVLKNTALVFGQMFRENRQNSTRKRDVLGADRDTGGRGEALDDRQKRRAGKLGRLVNLGVDDIGFVAHLDVPCIGGAQPAGPARARDLAARLALLRGGDRADGGARGILTPEATEKNRCQAKAG